MMNPQFEKKRREKNRNDTMGIRNDLLGLTHVTHAEAMFEPDRFSTELETEL